MVELLQSGFDVTILDDLSNSDVSVVDAIEKITGKRPRFIQVDLANEQATAQVFAQLKGATSVIHFAAKKAVGESVQKPLMYYRNNLFGLINVLEGMVTNGIGQLVFSSSCTVYGQPDVCPVTETTPRKEAESPYGNTKKMGEDIIHDATSSAAVRGISLRYFNPIGAHASGLIGELPVGIPNNLVPYVTQTAAGIRESLTIFGDDYPTADGTCIRDYIHVVDLAKAHVKALKRIEQNGMESNYEVFNIGTGKGSSVLEVVNAFQKVTGVKLNYKIGPRRSGDITEVYADTSVANRALGWKAELNLEDALLSSWNWEQNYRRQKA